MVRVIGCRAPKSSDLPGSVTSRLSFASCSAIAACCSASFRSEINALSDCFTSLISAPAFGRSSAESCPSPFNRSVTRPFLPSHSTRSFSSEAASAAASIAAVASTFSSSNACIGFASRRHSNDLIIKRGDNCLPYLDSIKQTLSSCAISGCQSGTGALYDSGKSVFVMHGKISQHTSIQCDVCTLEPINQTTVGQSISA